MLVETRAYVRRITGRYVEGWVEEFPKIMWGYIAKRETLRRNNQSLPSPFICQLLQVPVGTADVYL